MTEPYKRASGSITPGLFGFTTRVTFARLAVGGPRSGSDRAMCAQVPARAPPPSRADAAAARSGFRVLTE